MRLFGGERIYAMMETLNVEDNVPLQMGMLTRSIESAQKKMEGINFASRKSVLEYDDVMNKQRELIYAQRNKVLDGEDVSASVRKMVYDTIENAVELFLPDSSDSDTWNLDGLRNYLYGWLATGADFHYDSKKLINMESDEVLAEIKQRADEILARKEEEFGAELMREVERVVLLRSVDSHWMDHIDAMDELKQGIHLRAYGNHDPKVEYRNEGYDMFNAMTEAIKEQTAKSLLTVQLRKNETIKREKVAEETNAGGEESCTVRGKGIVSKNALCPCGSGKKYKRCCGKDKD